MGNTNNNTHTTHSSPPPQPQTFDIPRHATTILAQTSQKRGNPPQLNSAIALHGRHTSHTADRHHQQPQLRPTPRTTAPHGPTNNLNINPQRQMKTQQHHNYPPTNNISPAAFFGSKTLPSQRVNYLCQWSVPTTTRRRRQLTTRHSPRGAARAGAERMDQLGAPSAPSLRHSKLCLYRSNIASPSSLNATTLPLVLPQPAQATLPASSA